MRVLFCMHLQDQLRHKIQLVGGDTMIDDSVSFALKGVLVRFPVQMTVYDDVDPAFLKDFRKAGRTIPFAKRREMHHCNFGFRFGKRADRKFQPFHLPKVDFLVVRGKV